jgi:glucokinase
MDLVGAVDIGGTKIAAGLVDASGTILEQEISPTDREKDYRDGLARIQAMLHACLERRPDAHLVGVGVGCTGPVDPHSGVLGPNSFLPLWEGVSMIERLEAVLGVPAAIENDADAAALGEYAWGAGQGAHRCLYVTVSTGIGCGIVLDGQLYRGAGGAHPELGHMIIDAGRGPVCFCGGRGCWESLASGTGLADWYNIQRRERGQSETAYSHAAAADAEAICRQAVRGKPLAREAVMRAGHYLGIGLANLVTAFVPEVIVLGGGVMSSWPLFEGAVRAAIRQNCGLVPHERTELRLASLGARTGLAGAARVWLHRFGAVEARKE